jgi:hypothetical protein
MLSYLRLGTLSTSPDVLHEQLARSNALPLRIHRRTELGHNLHMFLVFLVP